MAMFNSRPITPRYSDLRELMADALDMLGDASAYEAESGGSREIRRT